MLKRLDCLMVLMCIICFVASQGCSEKSSMHPILQSYLEAPDTHPLIPNCSYAGYHAGNQSLPVYFPKSGSEMISVKEFGAIGDGKHDDTQAILEAVKSDYEYIFFPEGDYVMNDMIRIMQPDKVLFGEGPDKSRIHFQRSLSDVLGPFMLTNRDYNRWSNHGGLIWIAPPDIWDAEGNYLYQLGGPEGKDIGWINKQLVGSVCFPSKRGEDEIIVKLNDPDRNVDQSGLWILNWQETKDYSFSKYLGGHPAFHKYDWSEAVNLQKDWEWTIAIDTLFQRKDSLFIRLSQPLRADIKPEWNVQLYKPVGEVPYIEEVGIVDLSLMMKDHREFIHHHDLGYNGIFMQRSVNCWVNNVKIHNADNSIVLASSKNVTLANIDLEGKDKRHHGFYFRYNVHDCLLSGFNVGELGNEALSISYRSSGNVFRDGRLIHGCFDSHRGITFDHIRTNIHFVHNDGNAGGGATAGPRNGARVVHWNIAVDSEQAEQVYQPLQHSSSVLAGIQGVEVDSTFSHMPPGDKGTEIIYHNQEPEPEDLYLFQIKHKAGIL